MRLQISTDYAIRILRHLHRNKNDLQTAMEISSATGVTYPLFVKVANQLKRKDLLSSIQGRHGGYTLGRSAREISLYDVFLAVEGELHIQACLKNGTCTNGEIDKCKAHAFFDDMQDGIIQKMSSVYIADLVAEEGELEAGEVA